MTEYIDAATLQKMIIHAAASLSLETQNLNDLNVFPVPDGDTGTNMGLTMFAASTALEAPCDTVGDVTQKTASALLRGARGNSGVILSLLFRGIAKGTKENTTLDGRSFALAMDYGVATAYKAVMKPAEGTILTVSRMAAAAAAGKARETNHLEAVLEAAIVAGQKAVEETTFQNPVLKKAGVVDSGGKGFIIILQGMLDSLQGKPMPEASSDFSESKADFGDFEVGDIKFAYCTEFICARETKKNPDIMRKRLDGLGDSLVQVEDDDIIKVHVHTNEPHIALQEALTYGQLLKVKIENMREQHTEILSQQQVDEVVKNAIPTKKFGFVAVCAGSGLQDIFKDLGVDGTISGGQTMNPSTEDILRQINQTPAEIIYVLPNNKNIIMAAQQCVDLVESEDKKVIVIPSKSVPEGLAAMMMVDPEGEEEYNTREMLSALENVNTGEITYAARNSDFDGHDIKEGDYLALFENQFFSTEIDLFDLADKLSNNEKYQEADFISIYSGLDVKDEQNEKIKEIFEKNCPDAEVTMQEGGQPVYYYIISCE